jgi:hypothetical protein
LFVALFELHKLIHPNFIPFEHLFAFDLSQAPKCLSVFFDPESCDPKSILDSSRNSWELASQSGVHEVARFMGDSDDIVCSHVQDFCRPCQ